MCIVPSFSLCTTPPSVVCIVPFSDAYTFLFLLHATMALVSLDDWWEADAY